LLEADFQEPKLAREQPIESFIMKMTQKEPTDVPAGEFCSEQYLYEEKSAQIEL
jgi:hypothetical protein